MESLVSTEWLAAELGSPDLVVFEATLYLPGEGKDAWAEYLQGHIPGAQFFDIDAIADPETELPHMVPTPGRFARLVGALGVSDQSRVVFYDQRGMFSAARGWWLMRLFGHDGAAVLDGGLPKWRREGRTIETGKSSPPKAATFRPSFRPTLLRGLGDMLANVLSGSELVLDARSAGRFDGSVPEPRQGLRSGHIPGSRNLPYTELLYPDGTFRGPSELLARFTQAGADGSRKIVTSCGSGVTAAVLSLGLHLAGLPEGALYDGSWTEWASRPETPVEE